LQQTQSVSFNVNISLSVMALFAIRTVEDALSVSMLVTAYAISLPIMSYCAYQLHQNWSDCHIAKKYPWILASLLAINGFMSFIEMPFEALVRMKESAPWTVGNYQWIEVVGWECRAMFCAFIALRAYMLAYDHQYQRALSARKWKIMMKPTRPKPQRESFLDRQMFSKTSSLPAKGGWFLEKRAKWGNPKSLLARLLLPIFILLFIYFSLTLFVTDQLYEAGLGVFAGSVALCGGICVFYWRSLSKSARDALSIRDELRISIVLHFPFVVVLTVCSKLQFDAESVFLLAVQMVWEVAMALQISVMVCYREKKRTVCEQEIAESIVDSETFDNDSVGWESIIDTPDGYEQFANFLETEFSIENLFFVIEYVVLKNDMMRIEELKHEVGDLVVFALNLPSVAPPPPPPPPPSEKEPQIDTKERKRALLKSVKKLYFKYIDSPSLLPMNLPLRSVTKQKLRDAFRSLECTLQPFELLMPLLDEAAIEISSQFLAESFMRFRDTNAFRNLVGRQKSVSHNTANNSVTNGD